jgi:hypothetical protein
MICWKRWVFCSLRGLILTRFSQQKDNKHLLDLEYVQLNVPKVLALLNKMFTRR